VTSKSKQSAKTKNVIRARTGTIKTGEYQLNVTPVLGLIFFLTGFGDLTMGYKNKPNSGSCSTCCIILFSRQ
jgi:hypothetical protein